MSTREPTLVILVNGQETSAETIRRVLSCKITHREKKADSGTLLFTDPDTALYDSQLFKKNQRIAVIMGWSDELEPRGPYIVKEQFPKFPEAGVPTLTVNFQDLSHKMNKKQKQKRHVNLSATQIVRKIAKSHNLGFDLDEVDGPQFDDDLPLIQANLTDAALIQRLAHRYGYVWGVEGGTLYFRRATDRDQRGEQADIPVLSYRINDWSIRSFDPKVKYQKSRKRKEAKQSQQNIDLLGDGLSGLLEQGREAISKISPKAAEVLQSLAGEEAPESKELETDSTGEPKRERSNPQVSLSFESGQRFLQTVLQSLDPSLGLEDDEESEPGDESGAATPASEAEQAQRNAGKITRASELVEARLQLTVASMRWKPASAMIVAGTGERLSGRYRATEVDQEITPGSSFKTSMMVQKRTFLPDKKSQNQIASAADQAATSPDAASPPATTAREAEAGSQAIQSTRVNLAFGSGKRKIISRIDGKDVT